MRQASKRIPENAEKTVRDIRRATRRHADEDASRPVSEQLHGTVNVTIPWTSTRQAVVKGIIHVPAHNTPLFWPPPDHLWIGRKSRQFPPLSDRPAPAQASLLRSWH